MSSEVSPEAKALLREQIKQRNKEKRKRERVNAAKPKWLKCVWCKKKFKSEEGRICCSPECVKAIKADGFRKAVTLPTITKECEKCGKEFETKNGRFCSISCSKSRTHTEEDKEVRRKKLEEYHQTPEGAATRELASRTTTARLTGLEQPVDSEDFAVNIPTLHELSDFDEFFEGFDKGESW